MSARITVKDFQLANPIYRGASVSFYTVSNGVKTSVLATIYAGQTGSEILPNPQKLDSRGKQKQAIYIEDPVVATVDGIGFPSHTTGIMSDPGEMASQDPTNVTITGGSITGLSALGIRSTGAAFDIRFATSEVLTANRTISLNVGDANRSLAIHGDVSFGGAFATAAAFAITLTATALTSLTLPTTGTLATLAGNEALTNKTVNKLSITAPATGATLAIADGKALTVSNSITFTATDGSTLAIGGGGTLGTAAYTASSSYSPVAGSSSIVTVGALNAGSITSGFGSIDVGADFITGGSFIPSGSTVPTNGMYLPSANVVGFAANSTNVLNVSATGAAVTGLLTASAGSGSRALSILGGSLISLYNSSAAEQGRIQGVAGGVVITANTGGGTLAITGDVTPTANNTWTLGSDALRWGDFRTQVGQSYGQFTVGTADVSVGYSKSLSILAPATTAAIVAKTVTYNYPSMTAWNAADSGDNIWIYWTEGSGGTSRGSIDYNRGSAVVRYNTSSDMTLKTLIGDAPKAKSKAILSSTLLREYFWNDDPTHKPQIGPFAQELYTTFKGAVSVGGYQDVVDSDGNVTGQRYIPWAVDKTAFTFHLIAGWQDHETRLTQDRADIDAIIVENASLKMQLNAAGIAVH